MYPDKIIKTIVLLVLIPLFFQYCLTPEKKDHKPTTTPAVNENLNKTAQDADTSAVKGKEKISSAEFKAQISIKQLFVIDLSVPFEIIFFDQDKNINKDFQLKSNLIFKIQGCPFTISSLSHHYEGLGVVEFPYKEADFSEGVFRGKISLDRLITGSFLEVYLKTDNNELLLIGKTEIKFMIRDIGGVLFSPESLIVKAGQEFILQVYPFDYHGKHITTNIDKEYIFYIKGQSDIYINGIETRKQIKLVPSMFKNGIAEIKVKVYRQGTYRISYPYGKSFYDDKIKGSWNYFSFNIVPSEPVRSEYIMPEKVTAGKAFNIIQTLYDVYENRIESDQFDINIIPSPANFLTINNNSVKNDILKIRNKFDNIIITKAGIYSFVLPGIKNIIKKSVTIEPDIISCKIDTRNIIKMHRNTRIIIPFLFHDKYGNSPADNSKFKIQITYSSKGTVTFNANEMKTEINTIKADKYKTADILLNTNKKNASLIVKARNTNFLKIISQGNDDIYLHLSPPIRITRDKRNDRTEIDYTDSHKTFTFTPKNLSILLKKYSEFELYVTWQEKREKIIIQHEFTYYRELNRLDYQKWDLTNKIRLLRILWKDISETDIHIAASSGIEEIPGKNETFK